MNTVVTIANVALVIIAIAAAGLAVLYVAVAIGSHRHDPVGDALRMYRQERLLKPYDYANYDMRYRGAHDGVCNVCGEPSFYTRHGKTMPHPWCREDVA